MIQAVLTFAGLSIIFEILLILKLPRKWALKLLGSPWRVFLLHLFIILGNLTIHWGTITGSMTAMTAGTASFIVVPGLRWAIGYTRKGQTKQGAFT